MNEPVYICPQCGKTDGFTELVWEQRKYFVDRHREGIGFSDAVEDSEVLVQVTCDNCNTIVASFNVAPPKKDDQDFWKDLPQYWEDLPTNTDCSDEDGLYRSEFARQLKTDTANELDVILDEYWTAPKEKRITMNWIFVRLCGYTLPAIVKKAHGNDPNGKEVADDEEMKPENSKEKGEN